MKILNNVIGLNLANALTKDQDRIFFYYPETMTVEDAAYLIKRIASRVYKETGSFTSYMFTENLKNALPLGIEIVSVYEQYMSVEKGQLEG